MGNIKDLKEFKAEKNGDVTPEKLGKTINAWLETGEIESLTFIIQTKDGEFHSGWNSASKVAHVGLAEILKTHILDSMRDWG